LFPPKSNRQPTGTFKGTMTATLAGLQVAPRSGVFRQVLRLGQRFFTGHEVLRALSKTTNGGAKAPPLVT
jgi:hypothetical protein